MNRPRERLPVPASTPFIRFGNFQLDPQAGQLLKGGRVVRIKPQPFKLLQLLATRPGEIVSREEIRLLLWGMDTFVDFEQGVNTVVRQVRDALGEDADRPVFVETVPKRGYRFIAPVEATGPAAARRSEPRKTEMNLQKALWLNIAELRLAEVRRRKRMRLLAAAAAVVGMLGVLMYFMTGSAA